MQAAILPVTVIVLQNVITETNVLVSSAKVKLSKNWSLSKLGIQKWTASFHLLNKT